MQLQKKSERETERDWTKKKWLPNTIVLLFALIVLVVFFSLIPAVIFMLVEGWSYSEAFYYTFITMTTIGFGDFVVGKYMVIVYT